MAGFSSRGRVRRGGQSGTALIEFALVVPLFLTMLMGLVSYGGYFWRAHSLQQAANDAARASLAGLTASERETLALGSASTELTDLGLDTARTTVAVSEAGAVVTVRIAYDGRQDAFLNLGMIPLPSTTIQRIAAVRLGGL